MNPKALIEAAMGGGMAKPVRSFLEGSQRNAYVKAGPFSAYLRKAQRRFPGEEGLSPTLDFASVSAKKPGTGKFGELVDTLESEAKAAGMSHVYLENILNDRLPDFYAKRGYQLEPERYSGEGAPPSMYKKLALLLALSGAGAAAGGDLNAGA